MILLMIHLPLYLEKRLKELFPRQQDRYKFVAEVVEEALDHMEKEYGSAQEEKAETMVGGTLHLYTDGGSRGNPGQAAVGCVLEDPSAGTIVDQHYARIGLETNNVAEYQALIAGLKMAERYHPNTLVCHLDSELVVKQVKGEYRVKMPSLQPLVEEIGELSAHFPAILFEHIPRSDNHRADALVNKALDELPAPSYESPHST